MSNFVKGYSDFDMKPVGSIMGIGANIMECPNCHYSSYQINITIESRFTNNFKLWNELSEFQEIIKNYSGALRKYYFIIIVICYKLWIYYEWKVILMMH